MQSAHCYPTSVVIAAKAAIQETPAGKRLPTVMPPRSSLRRRPQSRKPWPGRGTPPSSHPPPSLRRRPQSRKPWLGAVCPLLSHLGRHCGEGRNPGNPGWEEAAHRHATSVVIAAEAAIQETLAGKRLPMALCRARTVVEPILVPGNAPSWIAASAAMTGSL